MLEGNALVLDLSQYKPAKVPTSITGRITIDAAFRVVEA